MWLPILCRQVDMYIFYYVTKINTYNLHCDCYNFHGPMWQVLNSPLVKVKWTRTIYRVTHVDMYTLQPTQFPNRSCSILEVAAYSTWPSWHVYSTIWLKMTRSLSTAVGDNTVVTRLSFVNSYNFCWFFHRCKCLLIPNNLVHSVVVSLFSLCPFSSQANSKSQSFWFTMDSLHSFLKILFLSSATVSSKSHKTFMETLSEFTKWSIFNIYFFLHSSLDLDLLLPLRCISSWCPAF